MSIVSAATPFDTLLFVRKLENAGVPSPQAEAQAEALSAVLQQAEESRLKDLASKGDILRLERDIKEVEANLKRDLAELKRDLKEVELRMLIKTGAMIIGGIGLLFGLMRAWPLPVQYVPPAGQEMRAPTPAPSVR
ncbi:MAG: DUF1640 domain-containing protein [Magnetococcales bacterium]|nr:DUF1640 domain-containing protein [Magnetococcales bacterium]